MNSTNFSSSFNLAQFIYHRDIEVRNDLSKGYIVSERDYVSTLMSYIRLLLRQKGIRSISRSQVLPGNLEQKFGCDAIWIIRSKNQAKVCLFEAKYPNLGKKKKGWDNKLTNKKNQKKLYPKKHSSRFNRQLDLQKKIARQAAIWELFILDFSQNSQPNKFDNLGSTCIWHDEVYNYALHNKIYFPSPAWTKKDLLNFVNQPTTKTFNLEQIIDDILACNRGQPLNVENGFVILNPHTSDTDEISEDEDYYEEAIRIPASLETIDELLNNLLKQIGIPNFLFIQLDDIE